jgi:predicted RNA binding protein YcfA (HicA-like mRNA interferase family)
MDPTDILQKIARSSTDAAASPGLRVVVVYQDKRTWAWAAELYSRVTQGLGADAAAIEAWGLEELGWPQVFPHAVLRATNADAVIVSLHATEPIPPGLRTWIDAWVPRRGRPGGVLIALIGLSGHTGRPSDRPQEYLRAVARQGRLEFLLHEYVELSGCGTLPARATTHLSEEKS